MYQEFQPKVIREFKNAGEDVLDFRAKFRAILKVLLKLKSTYSRIAR